MIQLGTEGGIRETEKGRNKLNSATDFLIDGRRIKLFGFLRITAGGLGLGAQLTPQG